MTHDRNTDIAQAAHDAYPHETWIFIDGAHWADQHPSTETINRIIELYKNWYSEQCDQPLALYVQQNWNDNETPYSLNDIMGDVQQDLDDFIDGFINTKNKQQ